MNDEPEELSQEECWELLRAETLGRLAFHLGDEVSITPVDYVVDQGSLLFRTAEGSKLLGLVMNDNVAFEIDGEEHDTVWSVVVHGVGLLLDEVAAHRADELHLQPRVSPYKYNVVQITPVSVSGRRFVIDPEASRPTWP